MKPHHVRPFAKRTLACWMIVLGLLLQARPVLADVVLPPPDDCPEGTTPRTGHMGPYCQPPPPAECPPGHEPRVHMANAYCEPPPAEPCPTGSRWVSTSVDDAYCQGGWPCDQHQCAEGNTCKESSLCVKEIRMFRAGSYERVSGVCAADSDCPDGESCVTRKRCDPDVKRAPVAEGDAAAGGEDTPVTQGEPTEEAVVAPPVDETDNDDVAPSRGCAVGPGEAGVVGVVLVILVLVALRVRRD